MAASMGIGMMMMLVVGNGGGELLDLIDSKAYWAKQGVTPSVELMLGHIATEKVAGGDADQVDKLIKQLGAADFDEREKAAAKLAAMGQDAADALKKAKESDDPEIALRAEEILDKLSGKDKVSNVRKLMAIRTLGELGKQEAIEPLKALLKSKEPFVAEYAQRAIDQLEGKKRKIKGVPLDVMAKDLQLLPANCGIVGQMNAREGTAASLDALLNKGMFPPGMDASGIKEQLAQHLTQVAEMTGNIRADAVTLGFGQKATDQNFFAIMIFRGKCDRAALFSAIKREMRIRSTDQHKGFAVHHATDIAIFEISDDQLIFLVAENPEKPTEAMVKALAAGKGDLMENKALAGLIKKATAKPHVMWMTSVIDETYKQAPLIAPFDTMTLTADRVKDGNMHMKFKAEGKDEAKTAAAVKEFLQYRDMAVQQMQPMAAMMPGIQKMADAIKAIKPKQTGGSVEMDATLDPSIMGAPSMMFMMMAPDMDAPMPQGRVAPVQRVQALPE
jgi:hypothetical protein